MRSRPPGRPRGVQPDSDRATLTAVSWWVVIGVLVAATAVSAAHVWYFGCRLRRSIEEGFDGAFDSVIAELRALREDLRSAFR